jgi:hypothetical protein
MPRRLLIIGAIIGIIIGKYAWRQHRRAERQNEAMMNRMNQMVPAMNSMSADAIADSDWSYSGPLGDLKLHFEADGKLTASWDEKSEYGTWEIKDVMLVAHIPGADAPHHAIFRKSTDELSGSSPRGMEPSLWSATRIR